MKTNSLLFWLSLFPYICLSLFIISVAIATIYNGHLPNFDDGWPEWADPIMNATAFSGLLMTPMMLVGISALLFCLDKPDRPKAWAFCKRFWPGALLFWAVFFLDPGGTVDWFLD